MAARPVGSFGQRRWSRIRFDRLHLFVLAADDEGQCGEYELGMSGLGFRNVVLHVLVCCASTTLLSWAYSGD